MQEASFEYLENEGERTLLEAMDSLEVAFSHQSVGLYSHIYCFFFFFAFVYYYPLLCRHHHHNKLLGFFCFFVCLYNPPIFCLVCFICSFSISFSFIVLLLRFVLSACHCTCVIYCLLHRCDIP